MLEPKHQQLLAVIRGEKPLNLNVPLGKSEDKLQTLLGLVVDLREDNERLHQENSYLRQLLQELESNPNLAHRWFDPEPETDAPMAEPVSEQEIIPAAEPAFDWEALYFDTQPALAPSHTMNGYQSNGNGHHYGHGHVNGNGNGNGHSNGAYVVYAPPPPDPTPPPVESISLEALMQEVTPPPTAKPTPTAVFAKPDPKPASFNAILRDPVTGRRIAEVALEGSLITSRDVAGNERRVWGFRLLQGSVQAEWRRGKHLYLCLKNGTAVRVRVAGLPSDESTHGYVEFV